VETGVINIFGNCDSLLDVVCIIVACIGIFAGAVGCGYAVYSLLEYINVPDGIACIAFMATMIFVEYSINRLIMIEKGY